ncbi:AAA family ATPase, partial [Kitasatospora sp. NPDC088346]|uniref:helix-turn-helix transcriptional regulator n=1 Tax=Kitasatospora sp. NPDC088346 TaxID=3364073 RepID=UPI00380AEC07
DRAGDPTVRVLAIAGDPGTGKTLLLADAARAVRRQGLRVRSARGRPTARTVRFGLLADALDDLITPATRARLPATDWAVLRTAFPGLDEAGETTPRTGTFDRHAVHRSFRRLLEQVAAPAGTTLFLDDVHAADDASLGLLADLVRNPPPVPLVIVLAYRPRQICHRLAAALGADDNPSVTLLRLGDLGADAAARLLGVEAGTPRCELLTEAGAGNPFYLKAVAAMSDSDLAGLPISPALLDPEAIPHDARAAVLTELDALTEADRAVATAAAVTGPCADTALLAEVTGLPEPAVEAALDHLAAADLLRPEGCELRFRHPLLAATVYHAAGHAWRRAAHRRAAHHLERVDAPVELRAHQIAGSARPGDRAAARLLVRAARVGVPGSSPFTIHLLRVALRLLPENAPDRGDLRFELACALGRSGRLLESRNLLHELLAERDTDTPAAACRTDLVEFSAGVDRLLGRLDEAAALVEAELAGADESDPLDTVPLQAELAGVQLMRGRFGELAPRFERIRQAARERGDQEAELRTSAALGLGATLAGDIATALALQERSRWLADSLPDGRLAQLIDAVVQLSCTEIMLDRCTDAVRHLERGLDVARRTGRHHLLPPLHLVASQAHARLGGLDAALTHGTRAQHLSGLSGDTTVQRMSPALSALPVLLRDGPEAAARVAGQGMVSDASLCSWLRGSAIGTLARLRLLQEDPDGCLGLLVGDDGELSAPDAVSVPAWCLLLTEAETARGEPDRAAFWAERCSRAAAELGLPSATAQARLARATLYLATGEAQAALSEADRAVRACVTAGLPLEEAQARRLLAAAFTRSGQVPQAQEQLGIAKQSLQSRGATWAAAAVTQQQRRLGAQQPRPAGLGRAGAAFDLLSARERQIVELVGRAMTNRQIGERLFLSPRTVEAHLTKAFAKLGVSTRAQVMGIVRDMGAIGDGPVELSGSGSRRN